MKDAKEKKGRRRKKSSRRNVTRASATNKIDAIRIERRELVRENEVSERK